MMKKVISYKLWIMGFFIFLFFTQHHCCAETISGTELIENADNYDGKEVIYEGEAIGEMMERGDGAWVNVYDGEACIGVWMTKEIATIIKYTGSYKIQGDIVRVEGIFNKACPEHGGDLDIHAISMHKIKPGRVIQEKIIPAKRNLLIILSVILCLILILRIFINK